MHEEALTKEAAAVFLHFSRFKAFYLVGGTALALHIGHRISVDFDFFSKEELPTDLLQRVKREFSRSSTAVTYRAPEQLNILINDIKTTFFHYPYPLVDPLCIYQGVSITSIREIAAMKAFSIGKRLSYKDYVDWYFMLKEHHVELNDVITTAERKFGNDFNDRLFLGQLASLEDIHEQPIDFLRDHISHETVRTFLIEEVKKVALQYPA